LVDVLLLLILRIVAAGGVETSVRILNVGVESAAETSFVSNVTKPSVYHMVLYGTPGLREMKIRALQEVIFLEYKNNLSKITVRLT
jgi:hypothetical protein